MILILVYLLWSLQPRACGSDADALSRRGSIYFEDADITASIKTLNGYRIAEAFNASNGVKDIRKMRWVSIGLPQLLIQKDQINNSQNSTLKFVSGGFQIFIKTLSLRVAQELAKEASKKYETNISISQFVAIDKHIGSIECSLDLFVNDTKFIKLIGRGVILENPIVVFFKLPSPVNSYVKLIRNETSPFIFLCNIELHGRIRNPNTNDRRLQLASVAEQSLDSLPAVFTEKISLTTEYLYMSKNDIMSECAAAVEKQMLNRLTATSAVRDSISEPLAVANQIISNRTTRIGCALAMSTRDDYSYLRTTLQSTNLSSCSALSIAGGQNFALYTTNATFTVPPGVISVRALAVGGGAGGASGCGAGGGSGYVRFGQFNVTPLAQIKVTVGRGGRASTMTINDNCKRQNGGVGGRSSFGILLIADGGIAPNSSNAAAYGGSGGGAGWGINTSGRSGGGGTNGANGVGTTTGPGGIGQGTSFSVALKQFKNNAFTAGKGGDPAIGALLGGGGGGGVLMNNDGPSGGRGQFGDTFGGNGYGAGGAGGKLFPSNNLGNPCYAGGDGADGFVYVEW